MQVWKNGLPGDLEGVDAAGVDFASVPFWVFFGGAFCVDLAGDETTDVTSDWDSVSLSTIRAVCFGRRCTFIGGCDSPSDSGLT